jgi:hypothetical protein
MEAFSALSMTFGVAALFASWVVLLIVSSKEDFTWGLCTALLPPLSYGYALLRMDIAKEAIVLAGVGCALVLASFS